MGIHGVIHSQEGGFVCQSNLLTFMVVIDRLPKITYRVKSLIRGSHFHMTGDEVSIPRVAPLNRVMGRGGPVPGGH